MPKRLKPDDEVSLVDHLGELRSRIIIVLAVLVVGVGFGFFLFEEYLHPLLTEPLDPGKRQLTTLAPAENFTVTLKVALYFGLVVASPVILYQLWAFIVPGLSRNERQSIWPVVSVMSALFLGGIAFAYVFVLPRALDFLLSFNAQAFTNELRAEYYFGFVSNVILGFGVVAEMPVLILALARFGIVDQAFLRRNRKYAFFIWTALSAMLAPADAFSMVYMMIPLAVLYEVALLLVPYVVPKETPQQSLPPKQT